MNHARRLTKVRRSTKAKRLTKERRSGKHTKQAIKHSFDKLLRCYGSQHWWPAKTHFEVMVGAILTQNTAWTHAEKAIANLRRHQILSPEVIAGMGAAELAEHLRPSGYFNIKAKRLQNFCRWYVQQGGRAELAKYDTKVLRKMLLSVNGIGEETADDILLYAFKRPVFVIDAYTRRLFSRLDTISGQESYQELQQLIEHALPTDAILFNEYHALIVKHAKEHCRKKPDCVGCCLRQVCGYS